MAFADLDRNQVEETECNPEACRALWCAVIAEQLSMALSPRQIHGDNDVARARGWFGSRDFHSVCSLIGLDGHWVNAQVQIKIAEAVEREANGVSLQGILPSQMMRVRA